MNGPTLFETTNLWKPSIFSYDDDQNLSLFPDLSHADLPSLAPVEQDEALLDLDCDFSSLPALDEELARRDESPSPQPFGLATNDHGELFKPDSEIVEEEDPWQIDFTTLSARSPGPTLHTWEAFQFNGEAPSMPRYLSEAGDGAFDAVLQRLEKNAGVLPQNTMLRACCSLVLGRSSVFFQWHAKDRCFARTLKNTPISGTSSVCSESVLERLMTYGSTFRRLTEYSSEARRSDCPASAALRHCVGAILGDIERQTAAHTHSVRSLLQLQTVIDRPSLVLETMESLVKGSSRSATDEEVITKLSDSVTIHAESGSCVTALMQQILLRVSAPWLQTLKEEVNLSSRAIELQRPIAGDDAKPGESVTQSWRRPAFLSADDWRLVDDTRKGIRALAQHVPHTVPGTRSGILSGQRKVLGAQEVQYSARSATTTRVVGHGSGLPVFLQDDPPVTAGHGNPSIPGQSLMFELPLLDTLELELGDASRQLGVTSDGSNDALHKALGELLPGGEERIATDSATEAIDLMAPLRPDLETQSRSVNEAILHCIFETYRLQEHLALHRAFHLFGSGDFATRLTTALFSENTQSAERKRGNVPTGQTMGLRLQSREDQRWPPASSELRLTLLNVLSDAHNGDLENERLPGGLSFAIRELSDAEIDKVVDPTSIHALDFLKLQYTPPGPLIEVFTPDVVAKYDSVFRRLLIQVRMLYTTQQLSWHCNNRTSEDIDAAARRFAWKARHVVTAISSHSMDIAIDVPWRNFVALLASLAPTNGLSTAHTGHGSCDTRTSISDIAGLHGKCLDDIRSSMFLRRKHEAIRLAMDEASEAILKGAAAAMHESTSSERYADHGLRLDKATRQLTNSLADLARKPGKDATAYKESDSAKALLQLLAWKEEDVEGIDDT